MPNAKSWCFTINNYTDEQVLHLRLLAEYQGLSYLVIGREVAPTTGTPHIQGYVVFNERLSLASVRELLPQCHLVRARGTAKQNFEYCSKDGDFEEYGTLPTASGNRCQFERFRDWCTELGREPTDRELIDQFPGLYGRYARSLRNIAQEICPRPVLRDGELRPWQADLFTRLEGQADDRTVEFIVDREGGFGKSWFCGYLFSRFVDCQLLGPGKRDDIAHAIDRRTRVFLFNIPRGQAEYLNYGLLEMIKDRMVLSPKYESTMKILIHTPHVCVFMNEEPDQSKMTEDRYNIIYLS